MAIKKSEIYSQLWAACDELRGGVEPARYKNYILTLLFVKYVSDRFKSSDNWDIEVPEGGSFDDIKALKNKKNIGEGINIVISKLAEANNLKGVIDIADFNSEELGTDKVAVDKLTGLVSIFEKSELDFTNNRAGGDDILGDAYEYLMRKFAQDSGKSKGQFYTPGEVSRIMAKVIGIDKATSASMTVYDPACGSGSLLIRAANEAPCDISIYGQEIDPSTAGLARMNLVLHNKGAGEIVGNQSTIANPVFKDDNNPNVLKTFDFIVVNPPFSDKKWTNGVVVPDEYGRYDSAYLGVPPEKNGDFAWLLHVIKSMDPQNGKAAVILPHGVLFRGNAEETIRKNIIDRGYIKGIIGLPANLFYGTGIPACIIILDKEDAAERKGIFMIDASKGFVKDGDKNRLREQDIHKIVSTYLNMDESDAKYARFVSNKEIKEDNDYNLNIPRYIDNSEPEDFQDIEAHLNGGIPETDIEKLAEYWKAYPSLRKELFKPLREGYCECLVANDEVVDRISQNIEFKDHNRKVLAAFSKWARIAETELGMLSSDSNPKKIIEDIAEELLGYFANLQLIDKYDIYEVLMEYWNDTMQDDVYVICNDGYEAGREILYNYEVKKKKVDGETVEVNTGKIKSFEGKLIPKNIIIESYFREYATMLDCLRNEIAEISDKLSIMVEENYCEDGLFSNLDNLNKTTINARVKLIKKDASCQEELVALQEYLKLTEDEKNKKDELKKGEENLKKMIIERYQNLTIAEIKNHIIHGKWFSSLFKGVRLVNEALSHRLSSRIIELVERYATSLQECEAEVYSYEEKVKSHLERMGFKC